MKKQCRSLRDEKIAEKEKKGGKLKKPL